jgi:hypothetical protein
MTETGGKPKKQWAGQTLSMTIAAIIGQVGCLTLVIIGVALAAGLWLDQQLDTRPLFTLLLILGSVPVTLYLMFRFVLSMAPKIQMDTEAAVGKDQIEEEPEGGEHPGDPNQT